MKNTTTFIVKRDDDVQPSLAITSTTTTNVEISESTSTTRKSYSFSPPASFAPLPSKTITTTDAPMHIIPGQSLFHYHLHLFRQILTTATAIRGTDVPYPPSFAPLASRAPNSVPVWTPSPTATASASPLATRDNHTAGLSGGQIAGIVIGSVVGALLFAYMFYVMCWGRRKALRKAREEKERKRKERGRSSVIDIDRLAESDDDDFVNHEKNYMSSDDNQPVTLPRQGRYDPNRIYSPTSSINDRKEDFRSHYRTAPVNGRGSSGGSSYSAGSDTPLSVGGGRPFYGGFNPYYGPMMQQQSPAVFNHSNSQMPIYAPQFMPVAPLVSPMATITGAYNMNSYQGNPAFIPTSSPLNNISLNNVMETPTQYNATNETPLEQQQ